MKYLSITVLLCFVPILVSAQPTFASLQKAAEKTNSTGVVVFKNGEKVVDYHEGASHEIMNTMSMTKSVVVLAFAKLLSDGVIDSLNIRVSHYYPEWKQGQKENITIRHLLNHTSGLQNVANASREIHPSPDILQLALCASVVSMPGSEFRYNNKAVNILPGIVQKASGREIDTYMEEHIFSKLEISDYEWKTDEAGNYCGMSGLRLKPTDVAKIGQLVLQKGMWENERLISEQWIDKMLARGSDQSITHGLLWWRIPQNTALIIDDDQIDAMRQADFPKEWIRRIEKIKGHYETRGALLKALTGQFSKKEIVRLRKRTQEKDVSIWKRETSGPAIGFEARGWLGQYLVIYPKYNLVAVRMVQDSEDYNPKTDRFGHFSDMVLELAKES